MSRVAKKPVQIPGGVEVAIAENQLKIKGPKGAFEWNVHELVAVKQEGSELLFEPRGEKANAVALTGTTRSIVSNMVQGVTQGFERKLELKGVGYRAQAQGKVLNLTLGFSHPVNHEIPEGITVETPSQTEIVVRGIDKQKVGQVAAQIRAYRPPEPYKGKGVRYADERVIMKEAKKK
ncbi:50S ribosomal protein L6 [Alkalilimnicola ehrlichii]|uniref:Large ribosomal subunit protein uL6 n=1 Tax=Alkalilimnicola ehrlichii TaxID=351052 RepID=A0A3E0X057_9GAMM|nr:50S ribosomal protein L6 [Alkalilimnicola ehrlichii]RFA30208.1 50S ribosomal protein L6 [Alkalilimnicola ehrlichii]RFA37793.1 50S ribosomal protein L6 [Alkalilimnicola ehrlichii]